MNRRLAKEVRALLAMPRWSARDVRAFLFIAYATLGASAAPEGLTPGALVEIGLEAIAIGLRPGMTPQEMAERIREHYREQPIDPALMREISALLLSAKSESYRPSARAARLLGA